MHLVVDIRHWLDEEGEPIPRLRRRVLRIARLIEYGGPLQRGEARPTLIECSCRPGRRPCEGLLWVAKTEDDYLEARCEVCDEETVLISGWGETIWADGQLPPLPPMQQPDPATLN